MSLNICNIDTANVSNIICRSILFVIYPLLFCKMSHLGIFVNIRLGFLVNMRSYSTDMNRNFISCWHPQTKFNPYTFVSEMKHVDGQADIPIMD
jgi:hypothetical protein